MKNKAISLSIFSLSLIILYGKTEEPIFMVLGLIGGVLSVVIEFKILFEEDRL